HIHNASLVLHISVPLSLVLFFSPHLSSFLFTHPSPTAIYTLSLHDALPICFVAKGKRPLLRIGCGRCAKGPRESEPSGFSILRRDRKSTRLNSSHQIISYAVFCLKKKKKKKKIR